MKFLIDLNPEKLKVKMKSKLVTGQLITPLTYFENHGGIFAIDNGAFSRFKSKRFEELLERADE